MKLNFLLFIRIIQLIGNQASFARRLENHSINRLTGQIIDQNSIYQRPVMNQMFRDNNHQSGFNNYKNEIKKIFDDKVKSDFYNSSISSPVESDLRKTLKSSNKTHENLQTHPMCRCQLRQMARIVNGVAVKPNSIPWQEVIIFVAHCIWDSKTNDVLVRVGLHILNDRSISKKTYRVERIYVHPSYSDKSDASAPGDVGLLKLRSPIRFQEGHIEPACLGLVNKKKYSHLLATGWGSTIPTTSGRFEFSGKLSNALKKAEFTTRSNCESSRLICIRALHRGQSICDGDSGGPLHSTINSKTSVIGVCSFGSGRPISADTVKYCLGDGAYTRISSYRKFIVSKIGNSNYCPG